MAGSHQNRPVRSGSLNFGLRRNRVTQLKDKHGVWVENDEGIRGIALDYFKYIFKSSELGNFEEILGAVHTKVTSQMSNFLEEKFTLDEV